MTKSQKREIRRKKAVKKKLKKNILIGLAAFLIIAGFVGWQIYTSSQKPNARIYSDGHQSITLYDDGNYTARLAHGVSKSGTYTESAEDGVTIVSFVTRGKTENGRIRDNVLTFPSEWDDGHGHGSQLRLRER
jgi:hypothetical protein